MEAPPGNIGICFTLREYKLDSIGFVFLEAM